MNPTPSWILALGGPQPEGGSPFGMLVPLALIFAMFYFLIIAPARKKQRKHNDMLSALKPGDKVVTSGGILGTVAGVSDTVVHLKIAEQVKIEVSKQAIAGFQTQPEK